MKLRWDQTGLVWTLHPVTGVIVKKAMQRHSERHGGNPHEDGHRLECCVYKPRNSKKCWHPPEASREEREESSWGASEGVEPCRHLDFRFGASRTVREYTSVVLSPQWVVLCYRGPWTLIHALFASDIFNLRKQDVSRNRPHLTMAVCQAHPQPPQGANIEPGRVVSAILMRHSWASL